MPPTNKAQKSGLTLPGYRYLGPFNSLFSGKPVNKADEAARKHDLGYSDLISKGENPYLYFNEHDVNLIEDLRGDNTFGGILARSVFQVKGAVAPALPGTSKGGAPKSDRAAKRKLYFARSNKGAKQSKMDNPSTSNEIDPQAGEQPNPDPRTGSGGSMGGGGKGGSGVGYSTGGWTGGSIFTENLVITKNTRQFICDIKNNHMYKVETLNTGDANFPQIAVTTPWSYFNFNQYSSHFSPNDWQHLVNDYQRFRPAEMRVRIYNLQIKQIVTDGAQGNLYNNDLTAGLHVFCDGDHRYPYVQHPWDAGCMPEVPNEIWDISQYAYLQRPDANTNLATDAMEDKMIKLAPLFMLENSDHEVLRTGEATEFHFKFDCEWVENDVAHQMPQMMYNPLVNSRVVIKNVSSGGSNPTYTTKVASQYVKPSNWYPGPGLKLQSIYDNAPGQSSGPIFTNVDTDNTTGTESLGKSAYSTWPTYGPLAADTSMRHLQYKPEDKNDSPILKFGSRNTYTRNYNVDKLTSDTGSTSRYSEWWMLPNQIWDSHPVGRYNSIWMKIPRTNRRTMLDPQDGTIPMTHPPGTIFIKLAKIPVPGQGDSYLNIYATGQVSCEMAWEVEKRGTKNWRPDFVHSGVNMSTSCYSFDNAGNYRAAVEPQDAMQTRYGHVKVL